MKQSIINTFNRVGIKYELLDQELSKRSEARNRFSGDTVMVTPLIAYLIDWIYKTSNDYEKGIHTVKLSDFDNVRYFILERDRDAYNICID